MALNTALMGDGAVIRIDKGAAIKRPIHLVFAAGTDKPSSVFTRSLVVVGEGAKATVIEDHDSGERAGQCRARAGGRRPERRSTISS